MCNSLVFSTVIAELSQNTACLEARHTHFNESKTTSTRTFVNLQLNKSKLSFCKSEILTNVNAAFVATRHGEFTNVSTNARFVFVNVTTTAFLHEVLPEKKCRSSVAGKTTRGKPQNLQ